MWSFDLESEKWSPVVIKSTIVPEPRSDFAHGKIEENLIAFGGIGNSELLNDLYLFNLKNNEWQLVDIKSESKPAPRRGACLATANNISYIFGGIVSSGYDNELWKFDWSTNKYELITRSGFSPRKSAFNSCSIVHDSNNQEILEIYLGEIEGEVPLEDVYQFNIRTYQWNQVEVRSSFDLFRTRSASIKINDTLIIPGGYWYGHGVMNNLFVIDTITQSKVDVHLDTPIYSAARVYYKDKIYIQGGGASFGNLPLEDIMVNDLIVIELNKNCESPPYICIPTCSKGTYKDSEECKTCSEGTYSDTIGSDKCNLCPIGYYSDVKGAESPKACKRCPDGFFNDLEGQFRCKECHNESECSNDTGILKVSEYSNKDYKSEQPSLYSEEVETYKTYTKYFNIGISVIFLISVFIIIHLKRTRGWIKKIDMYCLDHNYEENQAMHIRKTVIGGVFSLGYACLAICVVFTTSLSYGLNNIVETKGLVPLLALVQEYGEFISDMSLFELKFSDYGGECAVQDNKCTDLLSISLDNIEGRLLDLRCSIIGSDCYINFSIKDFELLSLGSVNVELSEADSYCSDISVKVQTSSSIPDENSTIITTIPKDFNKYYRGSEASIVSLLMTPSLFLSDTEDWPSELKGYHVSQTQDPIKGSQVRYTDISFMNSLKVKISLDKSDAVLLTQRLTKQDLIVYLTNLAGSIVGMMGLVGFFMNIIEKYYEDYEKRRINRVSLLILERNRTQLVNKNFLTLNMGNNPNLISNPSHSCLEFGDLTYPNDIMTDHTSRFQSYRENPRVHPKA